ncbi:glycosyltransferase family 4 protein [Rhizobium straminoryzae]|uniref:Glycosyltransferase family 4 protein n=1 Tax=Rhizobium straminoryzae TaxID=1387186 RepID=A0A549TBI4_9HYPH|nr:glycosyltransferase family 4 protein [Rhizobium straminoryzae]TRL39170.1 glycosyltransferase family 4 protein [Rhizobium straminoryzae]
MTQVLIIDTHPVQYRAPIYQDLARYDGVSLTVAYYNDASVRGYRDVEFQREVKWNMPLLSGYSHEVLLPGREDTRDTFWGFKGIEVGKVLSKHKPDLVIIHSVNHWVGIRFALAARLRGIACWLRVETQDEAFIRRSSLKQTVRSLGYRAIYSLFNGAFCFGELNRRHLVAHGFKPSQLVMTRFSTVDKAAGLSATEKSTRARALRERLGISAESVVVAAFGKLIPKKDPETVIKACIALAATTGRDVTCLLVGSGALEEDLRSRYAQAPGIRLVLTGFINQDEIGDYYLASDVVVLASRREGEVWGLVCNEALQAGCALAMSEAVGAAPEFGHRERCGIFAIGDVAALTTLLQKLCLFERDYNWASGFMQDYSTEAAASGLASVARLVRRREG